MPVLKGLHDMEVCILTEGGKGIGLGHVMRCLALFHAFKAKGVRPRLFINGDRSVENILDDSVRGAVSWLKYPDRIFSSVKSAKIWIIDSYLMGRTFYKKIASRAENPVYIDDYRRMSYPRGVVVNGSIYAEKLPYPRTAGVTYLLGSQYALLRRDFWCARTKRINAEIKNIMITLGGSDPKNMTPKILRFLYNAFPHLNKKVIFNKGFNDVSGIMKNSDNKTRLIYQPAADDIKRIMLEADLAISAGGQTLYELARLGVPTIALCTAANQKTNLKGWTKAGFIEYIGWYYQKKLLDKMEGAIKKLAGARARRKRSNVGKALVDGRGALRVAEMLLSRKKAL